MRVTRILHPSFLYSFKLHQIVAITRERDMGKGQASQTIGAMNNDSLRGEAMMSQFEALQDCSK